MSTILSIVPIVLIFPFIISHPMLISPTTASCRHLFFNATIGKEISLELFK